MSMQDHSTYLSALSQIPLTRSPFIKFPQAITLPYDYVQLPAVSNLPAIPDLPPTVDKSNDSKARSKVISNAQERLEQWEAENRAVKVREARKIAPGFLDTGITMLTPTRSASAMEQVAVDTPSTSQQVKDDYNDQFASLRF
ncbi:Putative uncharacterized protein [Taphrina deformans PYCC 5710]|uniref:Uncharacterized protein n=1 Tax=Taphrina deformans (strain PYCC 5710 / ATCC 11124 / CBS 356.35 / IMI 108563 / JCM 9778 / NBRC 8474) TaxID=1097556 RepID=R4X6K4_TAPDE|nr:Putative uncharacterized protein [Taphrina deformans PYCC 5710]|eukprot:CCG80516.1 Putative uncharacterized protein [Taphrina deformans PYCC 5710]